MRSRCSCGQLNPEWIVEIRASIRPEAGRRLPVTGRFWLVQAADSVAVLTNAQGVGRAEVLAGSYRIRSYQTVGIGALRYYWDVPVAVTRGMLIQLSERNAQSAPASGPAVMEENEEPIAELPVHAPASVGATMAAPPSPFRQPGDPGYEDPAVRDPSRGPGPWRWTLYAGEVGKGAGLLAVGGLGGALLISQLSCGGSDGCDGPRIASGPWHTSAPPSTR